MNTSSVSHGSGHHSELNNMAGTHALNGQLGSSASTGARDRGAEEEEEARNAALFGDVPEAKRRKFILVDDTQRGTRVRVRVMLDQVRMQEMPDSYRKSNSVFPRSWFPTEMQSPPNCPDAAGWPEDAAEECNVEGGGPVGGGSSRRPRRSSAGRKSGPLTSTTVPVSANDGSGINVKVPRISRAHRTKETALNDLGYRMSWSQSRVFSGRNLFLQRSRMWGLWGEGFFMLFVQVTNGFDDVRVSFFLVDAYRVKMRHTLTAAGQKVAPHFETRVGKRRWQERMRPHRNSASITDASGSSAAGAVSGSGSTIALTAGHTGRTPDGNC